MDKKLNLALFFGGRSGEHEVSIRSAQSVYEHLDRSKYNVHLIKLSKNGQAFYLNNFSEKEGHKRVFFNPFRDLSSDFQLMAIDADKNRERIAIDLVLPVLHGPLYEDGAMQGVLELASIPYIGAGLLSSAVSMDKDLAKKLVALAGIEVVPSVVVTKESSAANIELPFAYPVYVKPACMGSSVGISKVHEKEALKAALDLAFSYDQKALIEKSIEARELEVAVLQKSDGSIVVGEVGEIIAEKSFYSYEEKYSEKSSTELVVPAKIDDELKKTLKAKALKAFKTLGIEAMARVDFFLQKSDQSIFFNEVNTLPGFTSISMYPKLMMQTGMSYSELLDELIQAAITHHKKKSQLKTEAQ